MSQSSMLDVDGVLDAASDILQNDGLPAVTLRSIALRAKVDVEQLEAAYPSANDVLVAMLNRELRGMNEVIAQNIERDPRGGLLSRVYIHLISAIYERPLARTLFVTDRGTLNAIVSNSMNPKYTPHVGIRGTLIESLQEAGMVRADVDARQVSSILSTCFAGLTLTAPRYDLETILDGLATLLSRAVDADVDDTTPGKAVFFEWTATIELMDADPDPEGADAA